MIRPFFNRAHLFWVNLPPLLRFLGVLGLLAVLGLFALKPAYRQFKSWRLERNLVSAQAAVEDERMQEARDLSLTVLRSGDLRVDAFRILEKSSAALRDPRYGEIARALMTHPEGTDEDRLTGFRGIVMDLPLGPVGGGWASLSPELRQDPRFAAAFAGRLLAEKRFNEAAAVLLGVPEEKHDGEVARGLARVLIGSGKREGYDEAQRLALEGISEPTGEPLKWLEVLEEVPVERLQEEILGSLRDFLGEMDEIAPARAALLVARMDYAREFSSRAEIIDAAIARWKEPDPVEVAEFIRDLGLHARLVETFPVEMVEESPELFALLLEALVRTEGWEELGRLLELGEGMISKAELSGYRAVVAAKAGSSGEASQAWAAAINEAKAVQTAHALLELNRIATEVGMEDEAETAMVEAIRMGRGPLPLFADLEELMHSLELQGRETTLMEICAVYLQFEPSNPVLLTPYAYLSCLNGLVEPASVLEAMAPLAEAFPDQLPIQAVVAMAHLMNGQPAMAQERLAGLTWDPEQASPGFRMIYYASETLNGRMERSDPKLEQFPWKSLLPSERKKFSELIRASEP